MQADQPSDAQIRDFISTRPEIFSERRHYHLREITIGGGAQDKRAQITNQIQASANIEEFTQWLKAQNFKFRTGQREWDPERLPPTLAKQLLNTNPGQALVVNTNNALLVLEVISATPQPLTMEEAKSLAGRLLMANGLGQSRQNASQAKNHQKALSSNGCKDSTASTIQRNNSMGVPSVRSEDVYVPEGTKQCWTPESGQKYQVVCRNGAWVMDSYNCESP